MSSRLLTIVLLLAASSAEAEPRAITGATVLDGTSPTARLDDAVIVIEDERIACIGSASQCALPEGAEILDFSGRYITPGLIDSHVHFMLGNWFDTRQDSGIDADRYDYEVATRDLKDHPDRAHRSFLCSGITGVFDAGGYPWTIELSAEAEHHHERVHVTAAGPLITHVEAAFPLFTAMGESAFLPMRSDDDAVASVRQLAEMGADAVKVWYAPPPPDQRETLDARLMLIGREAGAVGLPLVIHATDHRGAKVALRAGAHALLHSVDDQLVDEEFLELASAQGVYYAPTLTVSQNWQRAFVAAAMGQAYPVDDPNDCIDAVSMAKVADSGSLGEDIPEDLKELPRLYDWLEDVGRRLAIMSENLRRVHAAGIPVATATDSGHPMTFHGSAIHAEMEAMAQAGLDPAEILVMSTRNGAGLMGRLEDMGTLEPGKIANLLILNEDPGASVSAFRTVTHVMRGGMLHPVEHFARPVRHGHGTVH